jgi:hypothetical protein
MFTRCKCYVSYNDLGHITRTCCTLMSTCFAMAAVLYHTRVIYECNQEVRHIRVCFALD